jgi:hypothetical protein
MQDSTFVKTWPDLVTLEDLWGWVSGPGLDGIYTEAWYNGNLGPDPSWEWKDDPDVRDPATRKDHHVLSNANEIIGAVRLRQVMMEKDACPAVPTRLRAYFDSTEGGGGCHQPYSLDREFKGDLTQPVPFTRDGPGGIVVTANAYKYQSASDLNGLRYEGRLRTFYSGGGYVQELPNNNKTRAIELIQNLKDNRWISERTRAVFIDFTLFNSNMNL